jgi:hypothetical protein
MLDNFKFPYLNEDQKKFIDIWFETNKNEEECIESFEINPFYFISKMLYCRNKGLSIKALCLLSNSEKDYCKKLFLQNFNKVIIRIEDLVIFLDSVKEIRGFGKIIRKAVYRWFRSKSLFKIEALMNFNLGNTSWTNKDILNKFHIKPWDKQISNLFKKFIDEGKPHKY